MSQLPQATPLQLNNTTSTEGDRYFNCCRVRVFWLFRPEGLLVGDHCWPDYLWPGWSTVSGIWRLVPMAFHAFVFFSICRGLIAHTKLRALKAEAAVQT